MLRRVLLAVIVVIVVIQFIPVRRSNPEVDPRKTMYAQETVPPTLKTAFDRSCSNCHTNQTVWPWYSYVAPVSWVVARDVHHGRQHMNFSEWGDYSAKDKEEKLEDICEQVMQGDMPQKKYVWVHRDARLKQSEREAVCRWTEAVRQY